MSADLNTNLLNDLRMSYIRANNDNDKFVNEHINLSNVFIEVEKSYLISRETMYKSNIEHQKAIGTNRGRMGLRSNVVAERMTAQNAKKTHDELWKQLTSTYKNIMKVERKIERLYNALSFIEKTFDELQGPLEEAIVKNDNTLLFKEDFITLHVLNLINNPKGWITDEGINAFGALLKTRWVNQFELVTKKQMHIFSSNFLNALANFSVKADRKYDYNRARNIYSNNFLTDYSNYYALVFPIHWGNHWTVAALLPSLGMALHWDSLSKTFKKIKERNELVISYLTTWYNQLHTSFGKSPIQFNIIDVDNDDNVPQQDNSNDCGAFAMSFMERIANPTESGIPEYPTIDQSLIPQWRKFVLKSIVRGYIGEF